MIRLETRLTRDSSNFVTEEDVLVVEIEKCSDPSENCSKGSVSNGSNVNDPSANSSREESSATQSTNACDLNGPMSVSSITTWSDCTYESLPDGRSRRREQKQQELEHLNELLSALSVFKSIHNRVDDCYTRNAMKVILNFQNLYSEYLNNMNSIYQRSVSLRRRIQELDDTFDRVDIRDLIDIPRLRTDADSIAAMAAAATQEFGYLTAETRTPLVSRLRAETADAPELSPAVEAAELAKLAAYRSLVERGLAPSPGRLFRLRGEEAAGADEGDAAAAAYSGGVADTRDGETADYGVKAGAPGGFRIPKVPKLIERSISLRRRPTGSSGSSSADPLTGRRWISEDDTPVLRPRCLKNQRSSRTLTRSKSATEERPSSSGSMEQQQQQPSQNQQLNMQYQKPASASSYSWDDGEADVEEPGYAFLGDVTGPVASAASASELDRGSSADRIEAGGDVSGGGGGGGGSWDQRARHFFRQLRRSRRPSGTEPGVGGVKRHLSDDCVLKDPGPAKSGISAALPPPPASSAGSNLRRKLSRSLSFFAAPAKLLGSGGSSGSRPNASNHHVRAAAAAAVVTVTSPAAATPVSPSDGQFLLPAAAPRPIPPKLSPPIPVPSATKTSATERPRSLAGNLSSVESLTAERRKRRNRLAEFLLNPPALPLHRTQPWLRPGSSGPLGQPLATFPPTSDAASFMPAATTPTGAAGSSVLAATAQLSRSTSEQLDVLVRQFAVTTISPPARTGGPAVDLRRPAKQKHAVTPTVATAAGIRLSSGKE